MTGLRWLLAFFSLVALACLCWGLQFPGQAPPAAPAPVRHLAVAEPRPAAPSAPSVRAAAVPAPRAVVTKPPDAPAPEPVVDHESMAATIDVLSRSAEPGDVFQAYRIIRRCVDFRRNQLLIAERLALGGEPDVGSDAEACGDISPGQVASRLLLLGRATHAGVRGAARALADEVPPGLASAADRPPDDPDVLAIQQDLADAIDAGARNGDEWSLLRKSSAAETPDEGDPDFARALTYHVAANLVYKTDNGRDFRGYQSGLERLQSRLTPEQAAAAIAGGQALAQSWDRHR